MKTAWTVPPDVDGERLDRCAAVQLAESRNQVATWIRQGLVRINGAEARPSSRVAAGDRIEADPPERREDRLLPEAGPLHILYQDLHLVVVDKPAGLAVHPGAGRATGTLAHRLLARFPDIAGVGGPGRPGIVHRLDMGTSGVLVVARSHASYQALARDFAERRVDKRYLAVVYGEPGAGVVDAPLGRHPQRRKEMAVRSRGRPARSRFRTLAISHGISLLEIHLETGRTHQIRVHLKAIRHPLVGDPVYGEARWKALPRPLQPRLKAFGRPALHAWRLAFSHPVSAEELRFEAPVPEDLRQLWTDVAGGPFPSLPAPDDGEPTHTPTSPA